MIYLIMALLLAAVVIAWLVMEWRRARGRLKEAQDLAEQRVKDLLKLQEAYRVETERMAALARGTDAERFAASIAILRELSAPRKR
jgi:hypothetical protein